MKVGLLQEEYRYVSSICDVISSNFYDNQLMPTKSAAERKLKGTFPNYSPLNSIVVWHMQSRECNGLEDNYTSMVNYKQVCIVYYSQLSASTFLCRPRQCSPFWSR